MPHTASTRNPDGLLGETMTSENISLALPRRSTSAGMLRDP
jgi:hypothetical protein